MRPSIFLAPASCLRVHAVALDRLQKKDEAKLEKAFLTAAAEPDVKRQLQSLVANEQLLMPFFLQGTSITDRHALKSCAHSTDWGPRSLHHDLCSRRSSNRLERSLGARGHCSRSHRDRCQDDTDTVLKSSLGFRMHAARLPNHALLMYSVSWLTPKLFRQGAPSTGCNTLVQQNSEKHAVSPWQFSELGSPRAARRKRSRSEGGTNSVSTLVALQLQKTLSPCRLA